MRRLRSGYRTANRETAAPAPAVVNPTAAVCRSEPGGSGPHGSPLCAKFRGGHRHGRARDCVTVHVKSRDSAGVCDCLVRAGTAFRGWAVEPHFRTSERLVESIPDSHRRGLETARSEAVLRVDRPKETNHEQQGHNSCGADARTLATKQTSTPPAGRIARSGTIPPPFPKSKNREGGLHVETGAVGSGELHYRERARAAGHQDVLGCLAADLPPGDPDADVREAGEEPGAARLRVPS